MRLIDADKLIQQFKHSDAEGINLALDRYAINCIKNAPTIDAAEVVRCEDCVHYRVVEELLSSTTPYHINFYGCDNLGRCGPMDYCSYGERKKL